MPPGSDHHASKKWIKLAPAASSASSVRKYARTVPSRSESVSQNQQIPNEAAGRTKKKIVVNSGVTNAGGPTPGGLWPPGVRCRRFTIRS
jgi:hypothetical protein